MKCIMLYLLTFFFTSSLLAQRHGVKGIAYDSMRQKPVADATITLLAAKDSSLVSFSMTDPAGRFHLDRLSPGQYRLLLTHMSYHSLSKDIAIGDSIPILDLAVIQMYDKSTTLQEVVVVSEAPPVTLIGDTVQYNAGSFKTQPNASVEQLLKKLPGVQVQKDGTIKAQGQTVNRVLVDGKEFFGNDPKMATKNLPADAVDKVQVYDKMTDQAQLTGFDDGNSEKTINLKLKKDKKKGVFGKVTAGSGTDSRFEGRANVNSFKGARQFSAIAMANNVNAEGFSFMDMMNFTGELGRMMKGGNGNININISGDDPGAGWGGNNQGIRTIWGGGINYNNIIGNKTEFTSNYFYNQFNPEKQSSILRRYILPDSSYLYNQRTITDDLNKSHRLNFSFDHQLDSFHSLKIMPSIGYQQTNNRSQSAYQQSGNDARLSNTGYSNAASSGIAWNFRNELLFRKKFRRRGRTLSLSVQSTYNDSNGDATLESVNRFLSRNGGLTFVDSIDQVISTANRLGGYMARLVYTEPVWRKSLLEINAGKSFSRGVSDKLTYEARPGTGKYDLVNDSLSSDFENEYGYINAGLRLRTQKKKYNYAVGFSVQQAGLEGKIVSGMKDSVVSKTFTNLLPAARFQYNFTRHKNLTFQYRTFTNPPGAAQLQPVPDITDPLNIKEGNPDLKQEYTHHIMVNYMGVNPFKNRNLFAFFVLQRTDNKIVNADTLLAGGIKKTRPVNVNGVYNLSGEINLGIPARFIKGSIQLGTNLGYDRGRQFINGVANMIHTYSAGPRVQVDINPTEKIDASFTTGMQFNRTNYSLQPAFNTRYFSQVYEGQVNWQLPKGFYAGMDFVYTVNNQLADGFNTRVPLWGASISKNFLRFNRGELKLRVNDILNRNTGASRSSNQNYIEDTRYNTIRRYALLSFTYSLSKTGLDKANGREMKIIRR